MTPEIKEMVESAANAMGYKTYHWHEDGLCVSTGNNTTLFYFNPLTSPADSHALMCELGISVKWHDEYNSVSASCIYGFYTEPYTTDRAAACRMAVLRITAEMGRRL